MQNTRTRGMEAPRPPPLEVSSSCADATQKDSQSIQSGGKENKATGEGSSISGGSGGEASGVLAVRAERLPGAERTGPRIEDVLTASETEGNDQLERSLLHDLATDMRINWRTLTRKRLLLNRAQTFLVAAILVELMGRVVQ